MQGPQIDNQYGEPVAAEKAPEAISKAVASLPPEQMFELMKQMKLCVQVFACTLLFFIYILIIVLFIVWFLFKKYFF